MRIEDLPTESQQRQAEAMRARGEEPVWHPDFPPFEIPDGWHYLIVNDDRGGRDIWISATPIYGVWGEEPSNGRECTCCYDGLRPHRPGPFGPD